MRGERTPREKRRRQPAITVSSENHKKDKGAEKSKKNSDRRPEETVNGLADKSRGKNAETSKKSGQTTTTNGQISKIKNHQKEGKERAERRESKSAQREGMSRKEGRNYQKTGPTSGFSQGHNNCHGQ